MTSVTDTTRRTARATEGARRATGVALAHALARSPHRVVVLLNCPTVDLNLQLFQPHVDARHHVLVDGLRGQTVLLSKDVQPPDRKSTRLNSSHLVISYAVFCLKKKSRSTPDRELIIQSAKDLATTLLAYRRSI